MRHEVLNVVYSHVRYLTFERVALVIGFRAIKSVMNYPVVSGRDSKNYYLYDERKVKLLEAYVAANNRLT